MKVYSLVGKSGTGKSYHAMNLCGEKGIGAIIDDGLLIYDGSITAGISAKRQLTKIGAIKTALFTDEEHRREVRDRIREINPEKILILGTSKGMVERIAERLELPAIDEFVAIEDITTEEQREIAHRQRYELGKHVIPVPAVQLKNQFSGYFLHPVKMMRGRTRLKTKAGEKSVVRPTYSYLGDFYVSDKVVADIVAYIGNRMQGINRVNSVISKSTDTGVDIHVVITASFGYNMIDTAVKLQKLVENRVEEITAFNVEHVDVDIKSIV